MKIPTITYTFTINCVKMGYFPQNYFRKYTIGYAIFVLLKVDPIILFIGYKSSNCTIIHLHSVISCKCMLCYAILCDTMLISGSHYTDFPSVDGAVLDTFPILVRPLCTRSTPYSRAGQGRSHPPHI